MKTTLSFIIEVTSSTDSDTGKPIFNIFNTPKIYRQCKEGNIYKDELAKVYQVFFDVDDPRIPIKAPEVIGTHLVKVEPMYEATETTPATETPTAP